MTLKDKFAAALLSGDNAVYFDRGTLLLCCRDSWALYYGDTRVAWYVPGAGFVQLNTDGQMTVPVKNRMNAALSALGLGSVFQHLGVWYYRDADGRTAEYFDRVMITVKK